MIRTTFSIILIVFLWHSHLAKADLVVQTLNGTQYAFKSLQIVYKGNPSQPITEGFVSTVTTSIDQVQGIVYVIKSSKPVETDILIAEINGAQAVIVVSPTFYDAGYLGYRMNDKKAAANISIPIFEVPLEDGKIVWSLVTSGQITNVTIMPDVIENPWVPVLESGGAIFDTIFLCAFTGTNLALGIWKVVSFVQYYGGFQSSMALYVLAIELFSNLVRLLACFDLQGGNMFYPEWAGQVLTELSIPFAISSYLLFTLYWHEMMNNSSVLINPFITRMKIPFFILALVLVILQVIRSIIRNATNLEFNFNVVTAVVYLVVVLALFIFYVVTGVRVLKRLKESRESGRNVRLTRATTKILVGGSFLLLFSLMAVFFITGLPYRPMGHIVIWTLYISVFNAASMMNILAFEVPSVKSSKTNSHQSSNKRDSTTYTNTNTTTEPPSSVV